MIDPIELTKRFRQKEINKDNSFETLKALCNLVNLSNENYAPTAQNLVLRALDQRELFEPYGEILNGLARQLGLYPYLDSNYLTVKDALAIEFHRPLRLLGTEKREVRQDESENDKSNFVFHRAQAEVYRRILDGRSVVLSAPTSFGKSSIVDALIDSGKFKNIVIVVPTIALIDETRRRLSRFRDSHKVITHMSQELAERNVFVFTQERVVDYPELPDLDLFVLDEFYKLNPVSDHDRSATLNLAFYKLTKKAKQFYLLGPNIETIPNGFPERFKCDFIRTDFATVVTELIPVVPESGKANEALIDLCKKLKEPTLIFCSSPQKARKITAMLVDALEPVDGMGMPDAADWIGEHYHPEWTLVKGLRGGIGTHHGRMPRALAHLSVKGFNDGKLRFLVCTSTLIEGVNTKAKNVIIFDNTIAKEKYDYFTFNNIRGRSGRMYSHFVGNVYMFHAAPEAELSFVDIPVFSQDESNTPESLIIQLEDVDLSAKSRGRLEPYRNQNVLPIETLRENSGLDLSQQLNLARFLIDNPSVLKKIAWTGYPDYENVLKVCELIWSFFIIDGKVGGISSGKHLAFKLNQLRRSSISDLIKDETKDKASPDEAVETILDFVRQWPQYRFGRYAMGINRIQNVLATQRNLPCADYSLFVSQTESLFSDPSLMALDEYGIPFPLAKKIEHYLTSDHHLDGALKRLKVLDTGKVGLTRFEQAILEDAKTYL